MAPKASSVTRAISIGVLNVFRQDRAYYWSFSQIKFYCVYSKMFFLIESFLSNRRL